MNRWRTQAMTPSSTITTHDGDSRGRLNRRDQVGKRVPQAAHRRHEPQTMPRASGWPRPVKRAVIRECFGKPHADSRADAGGHADQERLPAFDESQRPRRTTARVSRPTHPSAPRGRAGSPGARRAGARSPTLPLRLPSAPLGVFAALRRARRAGAPRRPGLPEAGDPGVGRAPRGRLVKPRGLELHQLGLLCEPRPAPAAAPARSACARQSP